MRLFLVFRENVLRSPWRIPFRYTFDMGGLDLLAQANTHSLTTNINARSPHPTNSIFSSSSGQSLSPSLDPPIFMSAKACRRGGRG